MHRFNACVLGLVLFSVSGLSIAERYRVVEDSFGNFDAAPDQSDESSKKTLLLTPSSASAATTAAPVDKKVVEEMAALPVEAVINPDIRSSDSGLSSAESSYTDAAARPLLVSPADGLGGQISSPAQPLQAPTGATLEEVDRGAVPLSAGDPLLNTEAEDSGLNSADKVAEGVGSKKVLGVFERAFLENEGANPYDATEVQESDFIDSQALLDGTAERESEQPFFVTRNIDGTENITFYSPSLAKQARQNAGTALNYSKATIYKESDADGVYINELPDDADPVAVQILSAGKAEFENYFDAFSKQCCEEIPKAGVKVLTFERSEHLKIERESLPYRFNEGDSRYLIFKLPDSLENFALQLRAFIRRFKDQKIAHGVFYPQLVMLDATLRPLRIIADPILDYTPETWSNYGYLQGVFEIDRKEGSEEVYVMLNTTKDHLRKVSLYEAEGGVEIRHMRYGELGVKALYADSVRP
jgi:hypothetical protein